MYGYTSLPWENNEKGQFNVPLAYEPHQRIYHGRDRLQEYFARERSRLEMYKSMLVQIGMSKADADAYVERMSFIPNDNNFYKRDEFIAEDWKKRHTYNKSNTLSIIERFEGNNFKKPLRKFFKSKDNAADIREKLSKDVLSGKPVMPDKPKELPNILKKEGRHSNAAKREQSIKDDPFKRP